MSPITPNPIELEELESQLRHALKREAAPASLAPAVEARMNGGRAVRSFSKATAGTVPDTVLRTAPDNIPHAVPSKTLHTAPGGSPQTPPHVQPPVAPKFEPRVQYPHKYHPPSHTSSQTPGHTRARRSATHVGTGTRHGRCQTAPHVSPDVQQHIAARVAPETAVHVSARAQPHTATQFASRAAAPRRHTSCTC